MKTIKILLLLLIIALAVCAVSAQDDKASRSIRKVMDDQTESWNRGDLESFMIGYWKSEKLKFVSGDRITFGWQPALDNYKKSYSTKALMGMLTFSDLDIEVLAKDAAFVTGSWHLKREKDDLKGKFTLLWRNFSGKWLIVTDHSS